VENDLGRRAEVDLSPGATAVVGRGGGWWEECCDALLRWWLKDGTESRSRRAASLGQVRLPAQIGRYFWSGCAHGPPALSKLTRRPEERHGLHATHQHQRCCANSRALLSTVLRCSYDAWPDWLLASQAGCALLAAVQRGEARPAAMRAVVLVPPAHSSAVSAWAAILSRRRPRSHPPLEGGNTTRAVLIISLMPPHETWPTALPACQPARTQHRSTRCSSRRAHALRNRTRRSAARRRVVALAPSWRRQASAAPSLALRTPNQQLAVRLLHPRLPRTRSPWTCRRKYRNCPTAPTTKDGRET
jgi:hypothetical protein